MDMVQGVLMSKVRLHLQHGITIIEGKCIRLKTDEEMINDVEETINNALALIKNYKEL